MARMVYVTNVSLDGFIEDEQGRFDWSLPDDELLGFIVDLMRPLGTHLYGRRLYETMAVWETDPGLAAGSELEAAFAGLWRSADKVVYTRTLDRVPTARTRLVRSFDPAAVGELKAAARADLSVGGADLAGQALRAGLVDEVHLIVRPLLVGGGKPALPRGMGAGLELLEERRFGSVAYLRYLVTDVNRAPDPAG